MSDVSVVVVSHNSAEWIERCLESVRDHETIVVDNASSDDTVRIVRVIPRWPRVEATRLSGEDLRRLFELRLDLREPEAA